MNSRILQGDCLNVMKNLQNNSIDCCITSPPYFGLRDYQALEQLGLEDTPEIYIQNLVTVFEEVKRILKPDGTCFIVIGDSYAGSGKGVWEKTDKQREVYVPQPKGLESKQPKTWKNLGIKSKDLIGIPWMFAFALRNAGWYLRQDIIWNKPNCMPSSVKDRFVNSHEHVLFLTKSHKYYFDINQAKEKGKTQEVRTKRNVWNIKTISGMQQYAKHIAAYPQELAEECLLVGCPKNGVVLDPFAGSGTTGVVAKKNERHFILIELNATYVEQINERINRT